MRNARGIEEWYTIVQGVQRSRVRNQESSRQLSALSLGSKQWREGLRPFGWLPRYPGPDANVSKRRRIEPKLDSVLHAVSRVLHLSVHKRLGLRLLLLHQRDEVQSIHCSLSDGITHNGNVEPKLRAKPGRCGHPAANWGRPAKFEPKHRKQDEDHTCDTLLMQAMRPDARPPCKCVEGLGFCC